jgi:RNA polymerase sigma-70 factor (ECF subfamily)
VQVPEQHAALDLADLRRACAELPDDQYEALILVGAAGFSYDEAAAICGCAAGTIKSRVSRARKRVEELLGTGASAPEHEGPDSGTALPVTGGAL